MQTQADPRKVAFVAVSFDRTKEAWEKYVKENEMTGVQLFETAPRKESEVNTAYHVKWIPSLYLIDEQGKVALSTVVLEKIAKALNSKEEYAQETYPPGSRAGGRLFRVSGGKYPFCLSSVALPGRKADLFQLRWRHLFRPG
jgi:phosphoribosylanthranilate isomerase